MTKPRRELKGVAAPQVTTEQVPPGGASDSHRHTYDSLLGKPTGSGAASQLDANGTILDVNNINAGEVLVRVGTTIVSQPVGAPGPHAATHQPGGVDPMAVDAVAATGSLRTLGVGAQQAASGTDARFTDARTPTAHKVSHQDGGADEISLTGLSGVAADPQHPIIGALGTEAVAGNDGRLADARTPLAHHGSHENGGGDEMNVAGLNGVLADPQPPIIGPGGAQAVAGNDGRLTDARTPLAHAASHAAAGGDPVTLTEAQITNLVADLAAKALLGVLAGSYDPGSVAMLNAQFLLQYKRLQLSGAERLTVPGTSNVLVADLGNKATRILGNPKSLNASFTVPDGYFHDQLSRLGLVLDARATLLGTADLILTDDFNSRSRIALAGRG